MQSNKARIEADIRRYSRVINSVGRRIDRRKERMIQRNPLFSNSFLYDDVTTIKEYAVLHHCKQKLIPLQANLETIVKGVSCREDYRTRNRLIVELSRSLGVSRRIVRDMDLTISQLRERLA